MDGDWLLCQSLCHPIMVDQDPSLHPWCRWQNILTLHLGLAVWERHLGPLRILGHGSSVRRPFEGAARNRSTRVFPDHGGTPRDQLPELGAREAKRASPTGLPL